MLPDGSINQGEMTSFNHYSLGSVASWLHKVVGGLSPRSPGWQDILFKPRPGGSVRSASASHLSPYGLIKCEWQLDDNDMLNVTVEVPANSTGKVELPGINETIGSGRKTYSVQWKPESAWPPKSFQLPFGPPKPDVPV